MREKRKNGETRIGIFPPKRKGHETSHPVENTGIHRWEKQRKHLGKGEAGNGGGGVKQSNLTNVTNLT